MAIKNCGFAWGLLSHRQNPREQSFSYLEKKGGY
jgi:hypothetical protein